MKTTKILSTLAAGIVLATAGACTDKIEYDAEPAYTGNQVFFNLAEIGQLDIETDATEVTFNLYRADKSKELTVGLESAVTNEEGEDASAIFGVPTQVTFPSGQNVVAVPVSILFDDVEAEKPYTLSVKVNGESTSPYGAAEAEFTLLYGTKYVDWREYLAGQGCTVQMAGLWSYFYESELWMRESINMPSKTQYRVPGPFSDLLYNYLMTVDTDYKLEVPGETEDCYLVNMPNLELVAEGFDPFGDGSVLTFVDAFNFVANICVHSSIEPTTENVINVAAKGLREPIQLSYFKPSTGQIFLNLFAQKLADISSSDRYGSYYPSAGGVQLFQFPGYKTYGVYVYDGGVSIDGTGLEKKNFDIYKTEETPGMKFELFPGTLTGDELTAAENDIEADEEIEIVTEDEITASFEIEPGDYTLVVIGVETDGSKVCSKAFSFTYEPTVSDAFQTIGYAQYTDGFMNSLDPDLTAVTMEVAVQTNPERPGVYRLKNPYRQWAVETENEGMLMNGNYYIYVNAEDPKLVYIEESCIGIRRNVIEGPVYAYSVAAQKLAEGMKPATIRLRKLCGTLENNVITFPVSQLLVAPESELPNYQAANTKMSFKLDLSTLQEQQSAPIRGTYTPKRSTGRTMHNINVGQPMQINLR